MRLARFTDYAIRMCLYLGAHQERLVSIAEAAEAHGLSHGNFMKVAQQLVEGGFVESVRGRSGGIRLARPASEIRIGELARFMEGDAPMADCASCTLRSACGLIGALEAAKDAFYASLDRLSLADAILARPGTLALLRAASGDEAPAGGRPTASAARRATARRANRSVAAAG